MDNRIGKFYISAPLIDDYNDGLVATLAIMGFIPTRVEAVWHRRKFEYIGISHMFREVPEGDEMPEYVVEVHTDENGIVDSVEVEEIEWTT